MRVSKWKPVCPECGYLLRGLREARCPECGVPFPTEIPTFRRWAVRRLPWDRAKRGSVLAAYLGTLAIILVLPWRGARGLAMPDHWRRALRWAGGHLAVGALACAMLANGQQFPRWLVYQAWPPSFDPPHLAMLDDAPAGRMTIWLAQSFVAWAIAIALPTAIGTALSFGVPGRHRAAKLGGIKWSLYLTSLCLVLLAGWYGYFALRPPQARAPFPMKFTYPLPPAELPAMLLDGLYGVWWAAGMAANPYNRVRGMRAFLHFTALYVVGWVIVTRVLFPVGALEALL